MKSNPAVRTRFWLQAGSSAAALILALATLISREWIEALTGWDPDSGSGTLEWLIVAALCLIALTLGAAARHEWHRPRTSATN